MELTLPRFLDVKGNKKGLYKYINSREKTAKNVGLAKRSKALVTKAMEMVEILNTFFASVFTSKLTFRNPRAQKPKRKMETKSPCRKTRLERI